MNLAHLDFKVDKRKIGFIRFIFEAYEGVAVITTLDPKAGLIRIAAAPDRMDTARLIIADLAEDCCFQDA